MTAKTVKLINGHEVSVEPTANQSMLMIDTWGTMPSQLKPCEVPSFAPYRLPSCRYTDVAYACDVEVTGRVSHRLAYSDREWVRVKVIFVHDGEPNVEIRAWMAI